MKLNRTRLNLKLNWNFKKLHYIPWKDTTLNLKINWCCAKLIKWLPISFSGVHIPEPTHWWLMFTVIHRLENQPSSLLTVMLQIHLCQKLLIVATMLKKILRKPLQLLLQEKVESELCQTFLYSSSWLMRNYYLTIYLLHTTFTHKLLWYCSKQGCESIYYHQKSEINKRDTKIGLFTRYLFFGKSENQNSPTLL